MKEFIIGEELLVTEGKITPTFKYKKGSVTIKHNKQEISYIPLDDNSLQLTEDIPNKVVNSYEGKVFNLLTDNDGRLETVETTFTQTEEVKEDSFKIDVDNEGRLETSKLDTFNNVLVAPKMNLNDKKVKVKYIHQTDDDVVVFTKNKNKDSLFKAYGSVSLKYNHKYLFNVNIDKENFSTDFVSKLDPFYSSVDKIRKDTGDLLENVSDETISYLIYSNSKYVKDKLDEKDVEEVPYYAKQFVRYKTDMDLINAIYLTLSGRIGSVNKKIGIISIDKTMKIPYINDMLGYFKDLAKNYEDMLENIGDNGTVATFVKASNSKYPLDERRNF